MKHTLLLFTTALLLGIQSYAQTGVAINTTGAEPDNSAMLDVSSTTKGVLVPRLSASQRQDIVSPAKGLLVFQENGISGFYYYDGSAWTKLASGTFSETDPVFSLSAAYGITSSNITNWNSAFGWGNHSGLYRPVSYVPAWGEITSNPFFFSSVANNQLIKYNSSSGKWENWTPNYLTSYTENDPVYTFKFDITGAANGDVLKFDGTKFVKFTPNFSESNYLYNSKYGVKLLARNDAQANVDFVISPKGNGAIISHEPDGNSAGGNNRGQYALDLQMRRVDAQQVASGNYSTISGGRNNTAGGMYSLVSGHYNTAQSYGETVIGIFATIGDGDPDEPNSDDRLFVIGNGSSPYNRRDALHILKDGSTTLGGSLTINCNGTGTSLTLPVTRGTSGNVLTTDGSGGTSWAAPAGGTVTGVTGTAPIASSGGNAPVISITAATASAAGSMSAADKAKLDAQTTGTATGQMQYWNGSAWVTVTAGINGQLLKYKNGVPTWVDDQIENLNIGDSYQGGVIAYFLQSGDAGYDANVRHGIIAAPSDLSGTYNWGCAGINISTSNAIGSGTANTAAIVAGCSVSNIAARVCSDLVLNGYDDWYLPSFGEMVKLCNNKNIIGGFSSNDFYSSSSQDDNAWVYTGVRMYDCSTGRANKDQAYVKVRPVRSF
jgi:hypothetical protein